MKNRMQRFAAGMIALSLCFLLLEGCSRNSGQTAGIQENRDEDKGQTAKVQEEESGTAAEKESGSTDSTAQAEQALTRTVTFTDDLGREVVVENPRKVAALIGSFADVWLLAGGEVTATVNDAWESLKLDLGEDTVNLGSIQEPDVERLIASGPDFVLASVNTEADVALLDIFEQAPPAAPRRRRPAGGD